ncbi:MAG: hypothetical protein AAFY45_08750 [Bacteroidota bacterium]
MVDLLSVEAYVDRPIAYYELIRVYAWQVKTYRIGDFAHNRSEEIFTQALEQLPQWLEKAEKTGLPVYQIAFLVFHEGREGMWILLNWWTGGEMLQTHVYFCGYTRDEQIKAATHEGGLICVWELEIVLHERKAWIQHVLQNAPNRYAYLADIYIQEKK